MARRRLNKNVVGWLTVGGILLSVSVVAVATLNLAKKDPEILAREAAAREKAGDRRRAVALYERAYEPNKEVKYRVESARVLFQMGSVANALDALKRAHAQEPRDVGVLRALLDKYWELADNGLNVWTDLREYADKLLAIEPKDVNALACRARALEELTLDRPDNARLAQEALEQATALSPNEPRLAQIRAQGEIRKLGVLTREARAGKLPAAEFETRSAAIRDSVAQLLSAAASASPQASALVRYAGRVLVEFGKPDEALALLEKGLAAKPDDVDVKSGIGATLLVLAMRDRDALAPEKLTELTARADAVLLSALETEPALYEGYNVRAQFRLLGAREGADAAQIAKSYGEALEIMRDGLRRTINVESIRAVLGNSYRVQLIAQAFDTAMEFNRRATRPEDKKVALDQVRQFLADAMTQYPELYITSFMQGEMAMLENDLRAAIAAYMKGEERTRGGEGEESGLLSRFNRIAKERLSFLSRQDGKDELARRYAQQAIEMYTQAGETPPIALCLNLGELLVRLKRGQEALDWAELLSRQFGARREIDELRIASLTLLGRGKEAEQLVAADAKGSAMQRARIAIFSDDLAGAQPHIEEALRENPENVEALNMYVTVMSQLQRSEPAAELLKQLLPRINNADVRLAYEMSGVSLTVADPKERDNQLSALIQRIEDPIKRARELYGFYAVRQQFDQAQPYLDELEKATPDDLALQRQQYALALSRRDFERAERYLARLVDKNVDGAKGSVLRGQLAQARNDAPRALTEFRAAEALLPLDTSLKISIAQVLLAHQPPRYDEALEVLLRVVENEPRNFIVNKMIYGIHEETGRRSEGVPYLKVAAEINPQDPMVQERSQFIEEEDDPLKGIARREKLRQEKPDDLDNLTRLAELYGRAGQHEQAQAAFEAGLNADPGFVPLARVAASYYARSANRAAGIPLLTKHRDAKQGVDWLVAQVLLSRYYEQIGEAEAAKAGFLEAQRRVDELVNDAEQRRRAYATLGFELADHYERHGKWQEMLEAAQGVLKHVTDPQDDRSKRARLTAVQALLRLQKLDDAGKEVESYKRDFPNDPRAGMVLAQVQVERNDLTAARDTLTGVLGERKDNPWAYYVRGQVNAQLGKFPEARADLLEAKRLAPLGFNLSHRLELVRVYQLMQQTQLAEAELRELVKEVPNDARIVEQLIRLLRNTEQLPKAQEFVAEMAARMPNEPYWLYQAGKLLSERGEFVAALEPLKRAVDITGSNNELYLGEWFATLLKANRAAEAVVAFNALKPEQLRPVPRVLGAEAFAATGDRQRSSEQFSLALVDAARAGINEVVVVIGRVGMTFGREGATQMLRDLLADPARSEVEALRLGLALARLLVQGDAALLAEAAKMVEAISQRVPAGSLEMVNLLTTQALIADRGNDYAAAIKAYEELLKISPDNIQALNNIAYTLAESANRPREALPYAERAARVGKDSPDIMDTVGWVYYHNQQYAKAETALLEATRLNPLSLPIRYHLGRVFLKLNRNGDARREFEKLLDLAQRFNDAEHQRLAKEELSKL